MSDNDAVTIREAIEKYQNHLSIKVLWENIDATDNFSFDLINAECIIKIINSLDTSKATQQGDVPSKVTKDNRDLFSYFISGSFFIYLFIYSFIYLFIYLFIYSFIYLFIYLIIFFIYLFIYLFIVYLYLT